MINFIYINNINKLFNNYLFSSNFYYCLLVWLFTSVSGIYFFLLELNTFIMLYLIYIQFFNNFFNNNIKHNLLLCNICYFFYMVIIKFSFFNEVIFLLSMLVKLSLFPFIWWYPYISEQVNCFIFFLLTIVQKFFPLVLIQINNGILYDFIFINLIIISIVISIINLFYNMNNIKIFLAWSSTINACWILLIFIHSFLIGFNYWFCYSIIFFLLIISLGNNLIYWDQFTVIGGFRLFFSFICLCSFSGFPPFLGFFYKYLIFGSFEELEFTLNSSILISFMIFFFIFLNSIAYIILLFKINNLIKLNSLFLNSNSIYIFFLLYFILSLSIISL
uniref:NADH dehydrogenase subunit 2 n=1 Tax=Obama sp. MAP-2014 TaxID=1520506 RepID=A0A0E3ZB74_9PLAT|nr:NADH dehydrogenase subunit 2 [Obama sp. MAP-2014]